MISKKKSRLFVTLVVACVFSSSYAQQTQQPKRKLRFAVSSKRVPNSNIRSEINHIGYFHIIKDRNLGSWVLGISETSQWKQMSEKQRKFVSDLQNEYKVTAKEYRRLGSPFETVSDYVRTPEGTLTYEVHGVSEQDTRRMVEAVIEWLDKRALEKLEEVQKRLERDRNIIAEAQKRLPKLETECKQLEAQADEKIKEYVKVNYGIDRKKITDHAKRSVEELARNLRTADFELVGLQARIDLAGKFKADGKITDQDTLIKLNQMLMADEIERAGVLARRNAYEAVFRLAKDLYDAISSRDETSSQKMICESRLANAKMDTLKMEEVLADPPSEMHPVEVYENEVTIHPVRTD